jgi:glycosyltransferase involved in cell wall biosynthesis
VRGLKVLYVGRLLHWKGVHLALRAFADYLVQDPEAHLTMQMDGPDRPRLEALARRLRIETKVTFDVTSTIRDVQRMYDTHDVFIFPSLHDSGSFVTLEAMGRCLPVICLNLGGPAHSVTDSVGIRVDARTPGQASRDLAAALRRLGGDPELRQRMGAAGRMRVAKAFDWNTKGDLLRVLYSAVVAAKAAGLDQLCSHTAQPIGTEGAQARR